MEKRGARHRRRKRTIHSVFERFRPKRWRQLCTVGDRRYDDALFLYQHGGIERWNSALYLAGFAVELYLKAAMLKTHRWLATANLTNLLMEGDAWKLRLYDLFWRSHDLMELLAASPELREQLEQESREQRRRGHAPTIAEVFSRVAEWNIVVRYTTIQVTRVKADAFMSSLKEVLTWLRKRIR